LGIIAIALTVALLLFLVEQARLAQLRRTLHAKRGQNRELQAVITEVRQELDEARGDYERARSLHQEAVEETDREIRS
jgi:multidrug resistance efflux pump